MSKVAKTPPVLDKSIKMEDDYLKSRRALGPFFIYTHKEFKCLFFYKSFNSCVGGGMVETMI